MSTRPVRWKLSAKSPPERVFAALAGDESWRSGWAPTAKQSGGDMHVRSPDGVVEARRIIAAASPARSGLRDFGGRARKGRVDFGIDLRNGRMSRSWDEGFAEP